MTTYQDILVETSADHLGSITLNRPDFMNTFSTRMAGELEDALRELDRDPTVRAIIVQGAGKAFCAGIDVNEVFGKTAMEYRDWVHAMEKPLVTISEIATPVITQIQGAAVANGTGLVAASDLAVAAENAKFGLTAIKVGLSCLGPVVPMTRLVGRKKALELLLAGEIFGASEALDMGLVNRVVPIDELAEETKTLALSLSEKSPLAVQISKHAFYASADLDYRQAFEYMNEAFARLCTTDDAKEGVKAFLEKRKPNWKGA